MILYLHGFRSSPQSFKARLLGERLRDMGRSAEYQCPQLPASPQQAITLASRLIEAEAHNAQPVTLIGSSLGGYYATWLAEQFDCRAVLLNPAVKPPRDLDKYVGATSAWHSGEPFEFKREYLDELKQYEVERITQPERYFLLTTTGDEVLDWRESVTHYPGARQWVIQGSDHSISAFADCVDQVIAFCGIARQAA